MVTTFERFEEYKEASERHAHGLKLDKAGVFGDARLAYSRAQSLLLNDPHDLDPVSKHMQIARILRDEGFSHVREALSSPDEADKMLKIGLIQLMTSASFLRNLREERGTRFSPEAKNYWRLQRGETLGAIGRLATAAFVLDLKLDPPIDALAHYEAARGELRLDGSRIAEAMNAVFAARHGLLEQGSPYTISWLRQADKAMQQAEAKGEKNHRSAKPRLEKRKASLSSIEEARQSVFEDP